VHPPIGTPIANVALYILDQHLEPVPPRVVGELYIGGMALATSYLNLEDETRARFVEDPFQPGPARLYRTGDLCWRDDDGVVSFVGRADQQIKLRGFRIEPGEIEVCLKRHPGVEDAVVVKRADASGEDQLVAYVVVAEHRHFDRWEMRRHLASELPAYMVPTQLVVVERFPMTSSGKVDRRRLPAPPDSERLEPTATHVAPRTAVEEFLVAVWRDLLHVDTVSVHDNFFDLGGHSLSATQLVSRIRDRYSVEVPIYSVFERPTLEMLAVEVLQLLAGLQEEPEVDALLAEVEGLSEDELDQLLADM
jgi:acyl carrier protein